MAENQRKWFKSLRMWKKNTADAVSEKKNDLFKILMREVSRPYINLGLSSALLEELDNLPLNDRKDIVNRVSNPSSSPLFVACQTGQIQIAEAQLRKFGAEFKQKGRITFSEDEKRFVTPLWCAIYYGKLSIVKLLAQYGADISAEFDLGYTPLMLACALTHYEIVEYLARYVPDINKPNYRVNGKTCLMMAVDDATMCYILLMNGADVNAKDNDNETALHYAMEKGRLKTIKLLLQYGADVKSR